MSFAESFILQQVLLIFAKYVFFLSGDIQVQAGNLCVDHEVHEGTLKYIGKKHYTLWNHEGTLKYIGKKYYILWNIHKYRDNRSNSYPNHTVNYIPLNYHKVSSSCLSLSFPRLWAIWN